MTTGTKNWGRPLPGKGAELYKKADVMQNKALLNCLTKAVYISFACKHHAIEPTQTFTKRLLQFDLVMVYILSRIGNKVLSIGSFEPT